ncbi:unnamed protein product [Phytomonas sp. EM1]|nr:unnamed protein product [Phytomonas sp. EM1]|eukprot:CCW62820.1 unnamed protein product [Phytomonas sp. isolate EM1]
MDKERVFMIVCAVAGVSALVIFQHFNTVKAQGRDKSPSGVLPAPSRPRHSTLSGAHSQSRARSQNAPNATPRRLHNSHHRGRAHPPPQTQPTTRTTDSSLPGVSVSLENRFELAADTAGVSHGGGSHANRDSHPEPRIEQLTAQALSRHDQRKDVKRGRYLNSDRAQKNLPPTADVALHGGAPRSTSANGWQRQQLPWKHVSRSTSVAATDGSKSLPTATQADMLSEQGVEARSLSTRESHVGLTGKAKSMSTSPYSFRTRSGSEVSKPKSIYHQDPHPEHPTVAVAAASSPAQPEIITRDLTDVPFSAPAVTVQQVMRTRGDCDDKLEACKTDGAGASPMKPSGLTEPQTFTPSSCRELDLSPIATRPDIDGCSPEGRVVTAMIEESAKADGSVFHNKMEGLEPRTERLPYFLLRELEEQVGTILQNLYHTPWKPRLWMLLYSYLKQLPMSAIMHLAQCETITSVVHRLERGATPKVVGGNVEKEGADSDSALLAEVRQETCAMLRAPILGTPKRSSEVHFEWKDKKIIRCRGDSLPKRPAVCHSINASTTHPSFHDSLLVFSEAETNEALASMATDADSVMTVLRHFRFLFTEAAEMQVQTSETTSKAVGVEKEVQDAACQTVPDEVSGLHTTDGVEPISKYDLRTPLCGVTMKPTLVTSEATPHVIKKLTCLMSDDAFQKLQRDPQYAVVAREFMDLALEVHRQLNCSSCLEMDAPKTPERVRRQPATLKKSSKSSREEDKSTLHRPNHEGDSKNCPDHSNSDDKQARFNAETQFESVSIKPHLHAPIDKVVGSPFKTAKQMTPTKPSLSALRRGLTSHSPSQLVSAGR